jgi:hypothetical protein
MKNTPSVKASDLLALVQRDYREKEKRSLYNVNLYIESVIAVLWRSKRGVSLREDNRRI